MNALTPVVHHRPQSPQRHRFTLDNVIELRRAGVLHPEARIELLDGEIIDMASEGELHSEFVVALNTALVRALPDDLLLVPGSRLSLSPEDAPVPDLYIIGAKTPLVLTPPSEVRLVIEVSDSSLSQDMGRKAIKYGSYGILEYWVLDVRHGVTHVHREPMSGGYARRTAVGFDQLLCPLSAPTIELVIADLPRLTELSLG